MKKKLFLGLIPAILALSACNGVSLNNNADEKGLFQEDTLIHEELFANGNTLFKKEAKNLPYVDETGPKIGVQKAEYTADNTNYLAIRFVATVNLQGLELAETVITWDRAVYTDSGSVYNNIIGEKQVKKVYETIYDGNETISAPEGYTHFVTYTLRNVPVANQNYVVTASLTINGVSNNKVCASSIDLTRQVSFDKGTTGYFLTGTFNNKPGVVKNLDKLRGDNDKAAFARHLKAGDSFLAVKNKPDENSFKIYPNTIVNNDTLFSKTNNKIVANNDGDIVFFFSNDGTLYSGTVWFYLSGNMNNWVVGTDNASGYIFGYNEETDSYELNVSLAVDNKFGVRVRVDNDHNARWWQGKYSWLNAGFTIADDGNYLVNAEGTYTARLYLNDSLNPLGLEKEGISPRVRDNITNIYVRGDAAGGWDPTDDTYLFVASSDPTYRCELKNVSLTTGFFKVSTYGTWKNERWQWNSYYLNDSQVNETQEPQGNAHHNQINCWDYENWNIQVLTAGRYDFFIRKDNNKLEINYLGE